MNLINLKTNLKYLEEYIKLCNLEWGTPKSGIEMENYIKGKMRRILNGDKVISVLGITENNILIGFVSLFKYDGDERKDLTPWYATMYVKKEYRKKGYSKILNDNIIKEASKLGYNRVYLKTNLTNYYEKFNAVYMEELKSLEKLYYIDC